MPDVVVGIEAERDYEASFLWYFERSRRAAAKFEEAFNNILGRIGELPLSFPASDRDDFRYALLSNYPNCVTFSVAIDKTEMVAVSHTSRKPRDG